MDKIQENIKKRKFAERLTAKIIEDADIPLDDLKRIKEGVKTTKDLRIIREIMSAALVEGDPITDDIPFEELMELQEEFKRFLVKSRRDTTKEELKAKRSPKA